MRCLRNASFKSCGRAREGAPDSSLILPTISPDLPAPRLKSARHPGRSSASTTVKDGKATAAVLAQTIETWKAAGPNARDIFLMQKLRTVMSSLVETIQRVSVDRVAYLPASPQVVQGVQLGEQVKAAFGVDLAKVVGRLGAPEGRDQARPLASRSSQ